MGQVCAVAQSGGAGPEPEVTNANRTVQNEMVSKPGGAMSVSQVVKTARVWSCLEDTDGQFLPNSMGREETTDVSLDAAEALESFAWKTIAQTGRPSRWCSGIPLASKQKGKARCGVDLARFHELAERPTRPFPTLGNTIDPKYYAAVQNLPPHRWYQMVPECCDVEVFFGNFRLILAERTWWESQHARNVNIRKISSIKHAFMTNRRDCGNKKMAEIKVEPPSANSVATNFNSGDQLVESQLKSEIGRCQNLSEERLPEDKERKLTTGELLENMAEHQDMYPKGGRISQILVETSRERRPCPWMEIQRDDHG
jgi:hypothetical protein